MGHKVNRSRATRDLEVEADPYARSHSSDPGEAVSGWRLSESHPLALLIDPGTNVMAKLLALVPDDQRSKTLVQYYVRVFLLVLLRTNRNAL